MQAPGAHPSHDHRTFRHWAKLAADGTVLAVTEIAADTTEHPTDPAGSLSVDVTALYPYDFTGIKASATKVAAGDTAGVIADLAAANKVVKK